MAQVVWDDDDGLPCDFVVRLKTQLSTLAFVQLPHFVTFPNGYALCLRQNSTALWKHSYRFINLGLRMIGSTDQKNVFGIDHIRAPERLGFTNDSSMPMFVRTLSNMNGSRVTVGQRWVDVPEWAKTDEIKSRFALSYEKRAELNEAIRTQYTVSKFRKPMFFKCCQFGL